MRSRIVLGSSSPYRKQIIEQMGILHYETIHPDVDEYSITPDGVTLENRSTCRPDLLTLAIARAKCLNVLEKMEVSDLRRLVITSDQVGVFNGDIREKPQSTEQCKEWLVQYQQLPIWTCTAIVVQDSISGARYEGITFASQLFHHIPDNVMDQIIQEGQIMNCCGGYIVSLDLIQPYMAEANGTLDERMGFPIKLVQNLLNQAESELLQE